MAPTRSRAFRAADHKKLVDALLHHGVKPIYTAPATVAAKPKPVHHVLRYVAAGIVVVLLLIGGGVWAYTRGQSPPAAPGDPPGVRRRRRRGERRKRHTRFLSAIAVAVRGMQLLRPPDSVRAAPRHLSFCVHRPTHDDVTARIICE